MQWISAKEIQQPYSMTLIKGGKMITSDLQQVNLMKGKMHPLYGGIQNFKYGGKASSKRWVAYHPPRVIDKS